MSGGSKIFLAGFDALTQAVRRARGANGRGSEGGLSLSQYGLLEVLADEPSARVQELAAHAGITASTATRILDALERREIVRRTRLDEDRRAVSVSLKDRAAVLPLGHHGTAVWYHAKTVDWMSNAHPAWLDVRAKGGRGSATRHSKLRQLRRAPAIPKILHQSILVEEDHEAVVFLLHP